MGVRIPQLRATLAPYRAFYGAAATTESLDECGAAFTDLVPHLVALAQEEIAVTHLSLAMRKTTRLVNALQKVVLPRIEKEIRAIVDGIEEDERDESVRRRVGPAESVRHIQYKRIPRERSLCQVVLRDHGGTMTEEAEHRLSPERWLQLDTKFSFYKVPTIDDSVQPMTAEDWAPVWRDSTLVAPVPVDIINRFEQARACIAYGCFFYPLYGLGIGQLLRVADAALLVKCVQLHAPKNKKTFKERIDWLASVRGAAGFDATYWHGLRLFRNEDVHERSATIVSPASAQNFLRAVSDEVQRLFEQRDSP